MEVLYIISQTPEFLVWSQEYWMKDFSIYLEFKTLNVDRNREWRVESENLEI